MMTRLPISSRFYLVLLLLVFASHVASSHRQHVHQYIAREGYSLLLQRVGHDIPALSAGIGLANQSFAGDSAWQKGCITTGAWREDDEDVVYHYDILPGLNYALTSITHFWDADRGDYTQNMFRLMVEQPYPIPPLSTDIGPFHNTFDKIMQFAHGGWVLNYPRTIICQNTSNNHYLVITPLMSAGGFGIPLEYTGLTDFYTGMKLKVRADQPSLCEVFDVNALKTINLSDVSEIKVQEEVRNIVVWEVLGRMCHLLGDMSVPAHAHRDEHGLNPDSYEDYVGGPDEPYKVWNHTNVGAPFVLDAPSDDLLHFLMYVTQQQSDHFGSNGPAQGAGNDIIAGHATQAERDFLSEVNLSSPGGPTTDAGPWTTDNLNIVRDKTMPMVIRATAGLLYWFCRETGLLIATPIIMKNPLPQTVHTGNTAAFSVAVFSTTSITYQWEKNQVAIPGATSPDYTTPPVTRADSNSQFRCAITNLNGSVTSDPALLSVLTTDVEETTVQPVQFYLAQNFPNPFNPLTIIKYTIAGARGQGPRARELGNRDVSLIVYDVLGRKVATLVNEPKAPGTYEVRFDGKGLSSGTYIYRLTAGSYIETRKMTLLK